MVVAVEDGIDLLEGTRLDMLVPVALLEQFPGIFDYLDRGGPQFAGLDLDVGSVQTMGCADFPEVIGLRLAALGNDQDNAPAASADPDRRDLELRVPLRVKLPLR